MVKKNIIMHPLNNIWYDFHNWIGDNCNSSDDSPTEYVLNNILSEDSFWITFLEMKYLT